MTQQRKISAVFQEGTDDTLFLRAWAVSGIVLFALTWKLWTPQTLFPQVPVFKWLCEAPGIVDWLATVAVVGSLVCCCISPRESKRANWFVKSSFAVFVVALSILFLLDQHRLQPWAWHWFVFASLLLLGGNCEARRWMRWIVISVYLYSAVSKLDYQFAHTVGANILATLTEGLQISLEQWSIETKAKIVLLLPLVELLVGVGLIFRRTRVVCAYVAILLHVALIYVLGPFGLNQQWPVLVWNAFFGFQACHLFIRREQRLTLALPKYWTSPVAIVALTVIAFPAFSFFGICDHWLAWELYAPRSSRVTVEFPASSSRELPNSYHAYLIDSKTLPGVVQFDLAKWSLDALGAPIYPQSRFQLGVACKIASQFKDDRALRVTLKSHSNRWDGSRENLVLESCAEIEAESDRFWLNARPRTVEADNAFIRILRRLITNRAQRKNAMLLSDCFACELQRVGGQFWPSGKEYFARHSFGF